MRSVLKSCRARAAIPGRLEWRRSVTIQHLFTLAHNIVPPILCRARILRQIEVLRGDDEKLRRDAQGGPLALSRSDYRNSHRPLCTGM
jgi:hypothetical protein